MCQVHKYLVCGTLTLWGTHHSSGWLSFVKLVMNTDIISRHPVLIPTSNDLSHMRVLNLMEHNRSLLKANLEKLHFNFGKLAS